MALPRGTEGVERVPPLLLGAPFAGAEPDAVIDGRRAAAGGNGLAGARTARLQVCSIGAKVKSSLLILAGDDSAVDLVGAGAARVERSIGLECQDQRMIGRIDLDRRAVARSRRRYRDKHGPSRGRSRG